MLSPEESLQRIFISRKWTLSLAESCTGGAIAAKLVRIPDCSLYFLGGLVAYSNFAKSHLLGIAPSLINEQGAVSEVVAREMARGACRQFHTQFSLAVTGIAGPKGGTPQKPVGQVCFAICGPQELTWTSFLQGDRVTIIEEAVQESLDKLFQYVKSLF